MSSRAHGTGLRLGTCVASETETDGGIEARDWNHCACDLTFYNGFSAIQINTTTSGVKIILKTSKTATN